jgi:hypothetical protein
MSGGVLSDDGKVVPATQPVGLEQPYSQARTLKEYVVLAERPVTVRVVLDVLSLILAELQVPPL